MSECYHKHSQLNHIRSSCSFLSRRSRIAITNLFKNGKALGAESSARGCFLEKKILYFRKVFGETNHIGGLFSKRWLQEPLQNIRWITFQQDLTACRRQLLLQRAPSYIWQGFRNHVWLQKQMEIEIIKLRVNSRSSHRRCSV